MMNISPQLEEYQPKESDHHHHCHHHLPYLNTIKLLKQNARGVM